MFSRLCGVSVVSVLALLLPGCNNAINPLCGSARPAPIIASLSPSTLTFEQLQAGALLTVTGKQFVSSSQIVVNGKALGATVVNDTQMKVTLSTDVIAAPGTANVSVRTPSGNSGDLGCSSGGNSTALVLTVGQ